MPERYKRGWPPPVNKFGIFLLVISSKLTCSALLHMILGNQTPELLLLLLLLWTNIYNFLALSTFISLHDLHSFNIYTLLAHWGVLVVSGMYLSRVLFVLSHSRFVTCSSCYHVCHHTFVLYNHDCSAHVVFLSCSSLLLMFFTHLFFNSWCVLTCPILATRHLNYFFFFFSKQTYTLLGSANHFSASSAQLQHTHTTHRGVLDIWYVPFTHTLPSMQSCCSSCVPTTLSSCIIMSPAVAGHHLGLCSCFLQVTVLLCFRAHHVLHSSCSSTHNIY